MALRASRLQPPVSRMLTKRMGETAPSVCWPSSPNRRFSWVQATTTSLPLFTACWKSAASRRHNVECGVSFSARACPRASGSRGIVLLQSQIRVGIVGFAGRWLGRLRLARQVTAYVRLCHGLRLGLTRIFPGLGFFFLFIEQLQEFRTRQLPQHLGRDGVG